MIDLVERLEAHMGKADIGDVLPDCREAASEIRRLRGLLQACSDALAGSEYPSDQRLAEEIYRSLGVR